MSKINVPLFEVVLRRDANTIQPIHVLPHELPVLKKLFGADNIGEPKQVDVREVDPAAESERLHAKYGADVVVSVFGDDGGDRLAELVVRSKVKATRAPNAAKGADGGDGGEGGEKTAA